MSTDSKPTQIEQASESAWLEVRKIVASSSTPQSTALGRIGKALGVRSLRFVPLWSNAGVRKADDEFEVLINTEAPGVIQKAGEVFDIESEGIAALSAPIRFTLAHEFAHLVFLKAVGGAPTKDIFVKNAESIENACNILARVLLIPAEAIVRQGEGKLLDLGNVLGLLATFRVSAEVFVRRLHLTDARGGFQGTDGFLALVETNHDGPEIKTAHVFGQNRSLERFESVLPAKSGRKEGLRSLSASYRQAAWKLEGCRLGALALGIDFAQLAAGKKMGETSLQVRMRPDEQRALPCKLRFQELSQRPLTHLVSVEVVGEPVAPEQSKPHQGALLPLSENDRTIDGVRP